MKKFLKSINPLAKGTKLYSIVRLKCPRCQKGNLFLYQNPYNLRHFDKMPDRCSVCGADFVRESGFYWGAMMISHATTTVLAVIVFSICFHFYGWDPWPHIIVLVSIFLVLVPVIFRNSRAIWINLFVKFDPDFD